VDGEIDGGLEKKRKNPNIISNESKHGLKIELIKVLFALNINASSILL